MQDGDGLRRDQRGFLGGLCQYGVARDERGGDLAGEDRQREVPRADAGDRAERLVRRAEAAARLIGVIAQEVDRLAHLPDRVRDRLAGLSHRQPDQLGHAGLRRVGGAIEDGGAVSGGDGCPGGGGGCGGAGGGGGLRGACLHDGADGVTMVGRVYHGAGRALTIGRGGAPVAVRAGLHRLAQRSERALVREVEPVGVAAAGVEIGRKGDRGVLLPRRVGRANDRDRIGDEVGDRNLGIGNTIDEGAVGAVFQQAADEIGEQRLVRADRRVDAAGAVQLVRANHLIIQRLAHAVEALELIIADGEVGAGHGVDGGQRLRIVGGKLRKHHIAVRQQAAGAGEVGYVGVDLARVDGEIRLPIDLRALDLGVPIGALDQPDHDAAVGAAGEVDDPVDDERAALAIGLDDEAEAVPAGESGIERQAFEEVEREFEAVRLLRVDVEADVIATGDQREGADLGQQLGHYAVGLRAGVAGVEGGQLDRDSGAGIDAAASGGLADRVHRGFIVAIIAIGVGGGGRGLAQHVVAVAEAACLERAGTFQRLVDRLASDELFAHHAHRHVDTAADDGFAGAGDEAGERGGETAVVDAVGELARHHQAPGGGVDEEGAAVADVAAPVAAGDLVADQGVAGFVVGDAQEGFGEAHQGDAFLAGQGIFLDEALDTGALVLGPQRRD